MSTKKTTTTEAKKTTRTRRTPAPKVEPTTKVETLKEKFEAPNVATLQSMVGEVKRKAMSKRIVTISYNDKRDSDVATTAYLTCENQFFSIAKVVPLNIAIELEQCLVDNAIEHKYLMHVPEMKNGKRTGSSVPKMVRKYNVHYEMTNESV